MLSSDPRVEQGRFFHTLLGKFLAIAIVLLVGLAPTFAYPKVAQAQFSGLAAPEVTPEQRLLYFDYGGWIGVGGVVTFAGVATAATFAINALRAPEPGINCEITPDACVLSNWDFVWTMSILAAAATLVGLGAWGTGILTRHYKVNQRLGWGLAGGLAAMPTGALVGFSIPEYSPNWAYFTMVSLITAGTMVGGGFYLDWIAQKRGHAWPEFAFGIIGSVAGSTVGSLICGSRPCNVTFIMGALGGIIGFGLSTLIWGFPDATVKEQATQRRSPLLQAPSAPMLHYSAQF